MDVRIKLKDTVLVFSCTGAVDDIDIQGCTMLSDTFEHPHTGIEMPVDVANDLAENYYDLISEKYGEAKKCQEEK